MELMVFVFFSIRVQFFVRFSTDPNFKDLVANVMDVSDWKVIWTW